MSASPVSWIEGDALFARVLRVRRVEAGTGVSYGYTWRARAATTIAIIALGYADGLPRSASNRAEVGLAGRRVPVVGRIAMNAFAVDAGDLPVAIGDVVQVWGAGDDGLPSADEWAALVGTTAEVLRARMRLDGVGHVPGDAMTASGALAHVDLAAIEHNVRVLRERSAPADLMVVVKAEALGHGLDRAAAAAVRAGVAWLGVLDVATAVALRRTEAVPRSVRLLAWLHAPDETFAEAVRADVDLGVATLHQLRSVVTAAVECGRRARVHLSLDTGLTRDGAAESEWAALFAATAAAERDGAIEVVGVMSHVAEAGDAEDDAQRDRFGSGAEAAAAVHGHPLVRHLAASAMSWTRPDLRFDLVRVGAHAVGIPVPDALRAADMGLRPAMTVTAAVIALEHDDAIVSIGAVHGMPLAAAGRGRVLADGRLRPVRELRASTLTVEGEGLAVGDEVVVFGSGRRGEWTVRQWGDACDTIGEEFTTQLRVPRADGGAATLVQHVRARDVEETAAIARQLAPRLRAGDLLVLTGPLGAGKTTFMRALGEALQVRGPVTSPTFVISREHPSLVGGPTLVHVDAYRLGSALELDDLDLDWEGSIVAVEWGRGRVPATESWLDIELRPGDADDERVIHIEGHGARWTE